MPSIGEILNINSGAAFEKAALDVFREQAERCEPYRDYLAAAGIAPAEIVHAADIPHMPIELFKSRRVYCGEAEPEIVFTSSTTGGDTPSRHYVEHEVEWWTLLFFMMLFAIAGSLEEQGVTQNLAAQLSKAVQGGADAMIPFVVGISAVGSAFVDNIVFVAAFTPVIQSLVERSADFNVLWWALLFGACFGGNITVVGSTANIVALGLLEKRAHLHYVGQRTSFRLHIQNESHYAKLERYNPMLFCMNDSQYARDADREREKAWLERRFPEKSRFEK